MKDINSNFDPQLANLDREEWYDAVEELAEEDGYFEPLGKNYSTIFHEAGPRLIVTFETFSRMAGAGIAISGSTDISTGWWMMDFSRISIRFCSLATVREAMPPRPIRWLRPERMSLRSDRSPRSTRLRQVGTGDSSKTGN
jgi:hypothetical protein